MSADVVDMHETKLPVCAGCGRALEDGETPVEIPVVVASRRIVRHYCSSCALPRDSWRPLILEKLKGVRAPRGTGDNLPLLLRPVLTAFYGRPGPSEDEIRAEKKAVMETRKVLNRARRRLTKRRDTPLGNVLRDRDGQALHWFDPIAMTSHLMLDPDAAFAGRYNRVDHRAVAKELEDGPIKALGEQFQTLEALRVSGPVRSPEKPTKDAISEAATNLFHFLTSGRHPYDAEDAYRLVARIMQRMLPNGTLNLNEVTIEKRDKWSRTRGSQWARDHVGLDAVRNVPIKFSVDSPAVITVCIIDTTLDRDGRGVRVLADNEHFGPGQHTLTWDVRDDNGRRLPTTSTYNVMIISDSDEKHILVTPCLAE